MKKLASPLSILSIIFFILMVSVNSSSCTKDPDIVHDTTHVTVHDTIIKQQCPPSITGLWIGTYAVNQLPNDPPRYFSFVIKPNGSLIVESQPTGTDYFLGTGTWTLNGNTILCTYTYPSTLQGYPVAQSATATYDNTNSKLNAGVWSDNGAPNGSGKFTMSKVN